MTGGGRAVAGPLLYYYLIIRNKYLIDTSWGEGKEELYHIYLLSWMFRQQKVISRQ